MLVVITAVQFVAGCLTLGFGLFLVAGAIRDLRQIRLLPPDALSVRTVMALGGTLLLAAGGYAARLAVPL